MPKISLFNRVKDAVPKHRETTFSDFCTEIIGAKHVTTTLEKAEVPLFSPVEYAPGAKRGNAGVTAIHFLALDFDKLPEDKMSSVLQQFEKTDAILYTTYSHPERFKLSGTYSFRMVCNLSRPVTPQEWKRFWPLATAGLPVDASCCDPARLYALAYSPVDSGNNILRFSGDVIDVDIVLSAENLNNVPSASIEKTEDSQPAGPEIVVSFREIKEAATRLARRKGDKSQKEAVWFRQLAGGLAYQTPTGGRHQTMLAITAALNREFPTASIESLAELFRVSHVVMAAEDSAFDPAARHVATMRALEGARSFRDAGVEQAKEEQKQETAAAIAGARGDGKCTPYTEEELDAMCAAHGIKRQELKHRWIARVKDACYALTLQGYKSIGGVNELAVGVRDYLAPAGIEYRRYTKQGVVYINPTELMAEHGFRVEQISYVMGQRLARLTKQGDNYVLCLPACELANLNPKHSERVDGYLRLISGKHYQKILDWLATVTDLSRATCAPYFVGAPGTGKSLFAKALAKMWGGQAAKVDDITGGFNGALRYSPLITIDEYWPTKLRNEGSGVLRDEVDLTQRKLNEKYDKPAMIFGAARFVLSANNDTLIQFEDIRSSDDKKAVAERVLYCRVSDEALKNLFANDKKLATHMLEENGLACHALWLKENRTVTPGRFLVDGEWSEVSDRMSLTSKTNTQACHWIAAYIDAPHILQNNDRLAPLARVEQNKDTGAVELLLQTKAYCEGFDLYLDADEYKKPTYSAASKALAEISFSTMGERRQRRIDGKVMDFRLINLDIVRAWMRETQFGDPETLLDQLTKMVQA